MQEPIRYDNPSGIINKVQEQYPEPGDQILHLQEMIGCIENEISRNVKDPPRMLYPLSAEIRNLIRLKPGEFTGPEPRFDTDTLIGCKIALKKRIEELATETRQSLIQKSTRSKRPERYKTPLIIDPGVLKKIFEQLALPDNGFVEKADFDQAINDNFSDDEGLCGKSRIVWKRSIASYRYWFLKMQERNSFEGIGNNYALFFTRHLCHYTKKLGTRLLTREQVYNNRSDPTRRDREKIDHIIEYSFKNQ